MFKREKQRTSNLLQSYVTRRFKNYLKIIVQHIALKEEKREQQSLLDQLDIHKKKEEGHHWIHYISQTIKSILKLKILKRKRWSKIQQIISLQSESSTQIIDLMASNQSKVALIQKTSNLTNIQYSHHQDNYNYWRIHININIMDYVAKQFLHLKSHHDASSLQTLWK